MRVLLVLSIAGAALVAGAIAERAKAEQAFLCDGGRIVYARGAAELERLKATDPCVAGYFGKTPLRGADRPEAVPALRAGAASGPAPVASARPAPSAVESNEPVTVRIVNGRPGADTWKPSGR